MVASQGHLFGDSDAMANPGNGPYFSDIVGVILAVI